MCIFYVLTCLLAHRHAEPLLNYVKRSFLEPKYNNFDKGQNSHMSEPVHGCPGIQDLSRTWPVLSKSPRPIQEDRSFLKNFSCLFSSKQIYHLIRKIVFLFCFRNTSLCLPELTPFKISYFFGHNLCILPRTCAFSHKGGQV